LPGLPSLRAAKAFAAVETSIARAHKPGFRVVHFSVLRTHVHLIVEARDKDALAAGMKGLKVRITKALNRVWSSGGVRRRGSVFAERYHVRALTTPRETRNGIAYVLNNHRRHAAQAGARLPKRWVDPCSSARQFDGWRQAVRLRPDDAVVAPPQTWLLAKGWRRAGGLLDARHVPAT
jgi:REP element-mobilizing transposase RayT